MPVELDHVGNRQGPTEKGWRILDADGKRPWAVAESPNRRLLFPHGGFAVPAPQRMNRKS
jgi:hypothetical protein